MLSLPDETLLQAILECHRELKNGLLENTLRQPVSYTIPAQPQAAGGQAASAAPPTDADVQDTLSLIREWAAEKYEALKDEASDHTERLALSWKQQTSRNTMTPLTERIVRNIILSETGAITVRYITVWRL